MRVLTVSACFCCLVLLVAGTAYGQELDEAAIERASKETLLSMPEPPLGYDVSKHPLIADGQLVGFQVQVMTDQSVSKVLIKVITAGDFIDRRARVAACKGYANGFVAGLKAEGFRLTANKIPEIDKNEFKKPLDMDLVFKNEEGTTILVRKRVFFTKKGFDISVISMEEKDLKALIEWADQVRPAADKQVGTVHFRPVVGPAVPVVGPAGGGAKWREVTGVDARIHHGKGMGL